MEHLKPKRTPSLQSYAVGFALSILLTLVAFGLIYAHVVYDHTLFSHTTLLYAVVSLAVLQFVMQSVFFLHLSFKREVRANVVTYFFMVFMVLFIAVGSIWIMHNLNANMSPEQMSTYLHKEN
jgi:cytochrome o ubiquinol oxidase operon protein cyoD